MNKKLIASIMAITLSAGAFSQSVKQNIDKAAKNPVTKENAAKADVRLVKKKSISDSSLQRKNQTACSAYKKKKTSFTTTNRNNKRR